MNVKQLIKELQKLDQSLGVRVQQQDDPTNYWITDLEQFETGSSGYELHGEVIINVSE